MTGTLVSDPDAALPELVWVTSPPPNTLAVLLTDVGELAGTLTIKVSRLKLAPAPATIAVVVHEIEFVPVQVHPDPPKVFSV